MDDKDEISQSSLINKECTAKIRLRTNSTKIFLLLFSSKTAFILPAFWQMKDLSFNKNISSQLCFLQLCNLLCYNDRRNNNKKVIQLSD
jgi:hypothetical protein